MRGIFIMKAKGLGRIFLDDDSVNLQKREFQSLRMVHRGRKRVIFL